MSPIGFLVSDGKTVKIVGLDEKSMFEKILDTIPELLDGVMGGVKNK